MSHTIIDRRSNPGGKNLGNRQRFLKRAKEQLKRSVKDGLLDRSITSEDDQNVSIPQDGIKEPRLRNDHTTGNNDYVLPGNTDYTPGDLIEKPRQGGGRGGDASDSGEGNDDFTFPINKDEFNDILFEDLELPDLKKKSMKQTVAFVNERAGFVSSGSPATLDLNKSMRNSLGRRIALKKPKLKKIRALKEELEALLALSIHTDDQYNRIAEIEDEISKLHIQSNAISFLDPIDLRYRNYEKRPIPKHKAVMFCVMDVSASMGSHEKELAKRFYLLLYLFLNYKYDKVDIVFIRHHSSAAECTEEEFFYSRETGGTIVSTGFEEMLKIQKERYPEDEWNMYCAQASDGDNFQSDNDALIGIVEDSILPMVQYFAYIEVTGMNDYRSKFYSGGESEYGIWPIYRSIESRHDNIKLKRVQDQTQVYSVFRELFEKDKVSD